jgi:transposase
MSGDSISWKGWSHVRWFIEEYPPELRERPVRMVAEISDQHEWEWAAISELARLLGVGTAETVRWVRQTQVDAGSRPGTTTEESAELKHLRRRTPNCEGPMRF